MNIPFWKKRSMIFLWASLLVVNLVVINIMYYIPLNRADTLLENHTNRLVEENAARWRQRVDNFIASMLLITDTVSSSSLVSDMARYDMGYTTFQYKAFQAQNYLRDIRVKSAIIEDIYVYIPKQGVLLSPNFIYQDGEYYQSQVYDALLSREEWDSAMRRYDSAQIISIPHRRVNTYYDSPMLANSISFHDGNYFNIYSL